MAGWNTHQGRAVLLPIDHIDTDQLIPARFMSVPRREGYGDYLLHDLRRDHEGELHPDFPLNRVSDASVLVSGHHFGSGSSREAAVYALVDAGIRVVIAPSFGDIFASNAVNNGLLPARIRAEDAALLAELLADNSGLAHIDLEALQIGVNGTHLPFVLDDGWRTKLINGWDDIDLTRQHETNISEFRKSRMQSAPWAQPAGAD
ncbi:3-isopropylmalate dehydratase small subunit [Hoeflea prorocentri]|uniref:3-isopropylmalate dehydratase n=1 Tax=Hoeflea prorocentri TaxID=1922333 RepID=A0A9X3UKM3_9HYPH|nr:3-isopropylmalate dehydratase small subunit [Hoeflea prorocentri]MCY6382145.1 3-isopropylmalate dehydratase small subunit [Hoeflea prorocentri]MDA5399945.1 3-isopropylmalate dehydratase small subunit [Hoeflea prorocentri]